MSKVWEKIKGGVRHGLSTAAEKSEEFSKIAKVRLDISRTRSEIRGTFADLGNLVYDLVEKGQKIEDDGRVLELVEKVKALEAGLQQEEERLEELKQDMRQDEDEEDVSTQGGT